ncbi:MAG TPA: hypothetical protein VK438_17975 [Xanthobacteraceae bacterium]|nr:hypothetical protein [Xanthobacteraceae bacterium]
MLSELQAILGPELQPMLLANGAIALFGISLIVIVILGDLESRVSRRLILRA